MKLRSILVAVAAGGLAAAVLLLTFSAPGSAPARVAPVTAAPAPPEGVPSRRETGGPDERLAWETQRLADPATGRIPADMSRREQQFAAALPRWDRGSAVWATAAKIGVDKFAGWGYRGPRNIGGRTRALAIDVADPAYQTLLAGGISGGMWRSTDDGANWTLTTGSTQLHAVSSVAQDTRPGHTQVWYYGTGEYRGNSADAGGAPYRGDGVFRSVDGGVSWSQIPSTAGGTAAVYSGEWQFVYRLAIDPSEVVSAEVYAAVQGFIERSTDGGTSWTRVLGSVAGRSAYTDVVVSSTGVVYASLSSDGFPSGVYRSTDGITWANITPSGLTSNGRIVLALAPSDESILYMLVSDRNGTANAGFYRYTYLSGDGSGVGGTWSDRSAQMASMPGPSGFEAMQCYNSYCQVVTVNPANPNIVYVGGMHLIRSTDGFATSGFETWVGGWQYTNHHADQHMMVFRPGSSVVAYTGTDGGVHKTLNANAGTVAWIPLSNGYNTSQFYTVAIDQNLPGSNVVIGGMQDNGTWFTGTADGQQPWVEILGGDGSHCAVADASGAVGRYLISFQNGVVYRMGVDNASGAWQTWTRVDPTGGGSYLFINPLIVDPVDTRQFWIGSNAGVWRNSDMTVVPYWSNSTTSLNWTHVTTLPSASVTAMAMTRGAARTLYYGTSSGQLYRLDNANTAPASTVPTLLTVGAGWSGGTYVSSIAIDPNDNQRLLVCVSNYNVSSIFHSSDGGATWSAVEGNLAGAEGPSVRAVAIARYNYATICFAGTSTGLYSTYALNGAATVWTQEAAGMIGNVVVDEVKVRPADGVVVAATHGRGVYGMTIPATTSVSDGVPAAAKVLQQNVPNPFNPKTSIAFTLPAGGHVSLVVFDAAGRRVRTLAAEDMAAGAHAVEWLGDDDAGRSVGSGVYLYHLKCGDVDEVRRMTLVR
jgi:hypothetical protein